jgi:hypothetical protein
MEFSMTLSIDKQKNVEAAFHLMKRHYPFNKKLFHQNLLTLRERVNNNDIPSPSTGICANVDHGSININNNRGYYTAVSYYARKWKEHCGISCYPMGYTYGWEGEVGAKRRRLLDYLIEKTR